MAVATRERPSKFSFAATAPPTQAKKTPRAADLVIGHVAPLRPPDVVKKMLSTGHTMLMGIDVETHALIPPESNLQEWQVCIWHRQ